MQRAPNNGGDDGIGRGDKVPNFSLSFSFYSSQWEHAQRYKNKIINSVYFYAFNICFSRFLIYIINIFHFLEFRKLFSSSSSSFFLQNSLSYDLRWDGR